MVEKDMKQFLLWCMTLIAFVGKAQALDFVAAAPGRIEGASDTMPLGLAGNGTVDELLVAEGDRVQKGQLLLRLGCRPIVHEIANAKAQLAAAEAVLLKLKNGPRPREIETAEANVLVAEARAEEARLAYDRLSKLRESSSATVADVLRAERDKNASAGVLMAARDQLALLREGTRQEEIDEAQARVDALAELINQDDARLDQCSIRAPSSGIILLTNVTVGQFITSTIPMTLITMADDSTLKVRAEVDERDLAKVCLRQQAVITADGYPGQEVTGEVIALMPRMGRRRVLSGDPAEKADKDVRETLVSLPSGAPLWPIGLRVVVRFSKCEHPSAAQVTK